MSNLFILLLDRLGYFEKLSEPYLKLILLMIATFLIIIFLAFHFKNNDVEDKLNHHNYNLNQVYGDKRYHEFELYKENEK